MEGISPTTGLDCTIRTAAEPGPTVYLITFKLPSRGSS
ncbi:hypothetical protein J2S64_002179 [Paeniglutamicibacter sulfureus]|uniref:Uncharacterized protein n=1 Tax=Paeniglutamicibacter sulfureus TaxID=43666 RepID=A0ABU2BIQ6_9MICC|nr:hypothetical protein [Paeniglutamicibacter sulfureus]